MPNLRFGSCPLLRLQYLLILFPGFNGCLIWLRLVLIVSSYWSTSFHHVNTVHSVMLLLTLIHWLIVHCVALWTLAAWIWTSVSFSDVALIQRCCFLFRVRVSIIRFFDSIKSVTINKVLDGVRINVLSFSTSLGRRCSFNRVLAVFNNWWSTSFSNQHSFVKGLRQVGSF